MTSNGLAFSEQEEVALNRVLSCASAPLVPAGLSDRIAIVVTNLPQGRINDVGFRPVKSQAFKRHAIAASLAMVTVLAGVAGYGLERTPRAAQPAAQASSAPLPPSPIAVSSVSDITADAGDDHVPAMATAPSSAKPHPARPAKAQVVAPVTVAIVDDPLAGMQNQLTKPEPAPASDPVGPVLAEEDVGPPDSALDAAVFGPPAPIGMGIRGSAPSSLPDGGASVPRPAGFPGGRHPF